MTFLACALHLLFVRSCHLAHHGLYCSHVCACTHHSFLQHLPIWMNFRTCGCLLAPQGGITLTTRVFRSQHYTLSNSYMLVRAPRPLCRYRPPHGSHTVQRLQALCSVHRLHTVPSVHRFRRAPTALSQLTLCQPRSLRPPRSSPFAEFLERCISLSAPPPPPRPIPTPPLDAATQTIPHIAVSQDVSTQLSLEEFSLRCVHPHDPSRVLAIVKRDWSICSCAQLEVSCDATISPTSRLRGSGYSLEPSVKYVPGPQ